MIRAFFSKIRTLPFFIFEKRAEIDLLPTPSSCAPDTPRDDNVSMRSQKLETPNFCGDTTKWSEFWDSYEAAFDQSNLLDIKIFN